MTETGVYYRLMVEHVKRVLGDIKRVVPDYDAAQGYEIAGFAWLQGWNDLVDGDVYPQRQKPGGYAAYSEVMAHFIRDVRKDFNAPKMPFVIGVLGVGSLRLKLASSEDVTRVCRGHIKFKHFSGRDTTSGTDG